MTAKFFPPSAVVAEQLDAAMCDALVQSLDYLRSDPDGPLAGVAQDLVVFPAGWRPGFLDFGAYFDIVMAGAADPADSAQTLGPDPDVAVTGALGWFSRCLKDDAGTASVPRVDAARAPRISTLTARFYPPSEVGRITRWFDIEPGNSMAMTGLDDEELATAARRIRQALDALAITAPELFDEISTLHKDIVLAQPDGHQRMTFRGATSFALWGAVALNHQEHPAWWSYVPTLVHEAAHALLFAHARREPLVLNDPQTRYTSPLRDDPRPMDGIFHAAFVSAREAYALQKYLEHPASAQDPQAVAALKTQRMESVEAFWECLAQIDRFGQLTPLGRDILDEVSAYMRVSFPAAQ